MSLRNITLIIAFLCCHIIVGQKNVSITIDDIPNTSRFQKDGYKSVLLNKLDSLKIPIAIFINEGLIYKTDSVSKNFELLNNWVKKEYITLGNHSFSHSRYSEIGIDSFKIEILKGESISKELSKKHNKTLHYFRFPFNDLGKDSTQHIKVKQFLKEINYQVTPFTIESSDWIYNYLYVHYLNHNDYVKANEIAQEYLTMTLAYFDFFDKLSRKEYGRSINQIYLCHDNRINADFLPVLVQELKNKNYKFVDLKEALSDSVYSTKDNYFKKWGVSWLYRWENDKKKRMIKMKQEPSIINTIERYEKIVAENKLNK